jgi:hypothetical protein
VRRTDLTLEIRKGLKAIYKPGDIVEVRAFGADGSKHVGRFPLGWDLAHAIEAEDNAGRDVYYCLNPTGLAPMPMTDGAIATKNEDVPRRKHFLLDFDPVRKHKIATDEQHAAAELASRHARKFLERPDIIHASSGNGVHLLVPIDCPNDEPSKAQIKKVQMIVSKKFSNPDVTVDIFPDAARLVRAYGTLNKKGIQNETLKWRRSGLL